MGGDYTRRRLEVRVMVIYRDGYFLQLLEITTRS